MPRTLSPYLSMLSAGAPGVTQQQGANRDQTDRMLAGMQDALKDELKHPLDVVVKNVTCTIIKLHNHSARAGPLFSFQEFFSFAILGI